MFQPEFSASVLLNLLVFLAKLTLKSAANIPSTKTGDEPIPLRQDYLCNNGTALRCKCFPTTADSRSVAIEPEPDSVGDCRSLIGQNNLSVIRLDVAGCFRVEDVLLSSGETKESLLRRRIAVLANKYCQNAAHHCLDVALPIQPSSVVLLQVSTGAKTKGKQATALSNTVVHFATLRSRREPHLDSSNTVNPELMQQILRSQKKHLSRMLGNVTVQNIAVDVLFSTRPDVINSKSRAVKITWLYIGIIVGGSLLAAIYVVSIIKAVVDRKAIKQRNEARATTTNQNAPKSAKTPTPSGGDAPSSKKRNNSNSVVHTEKLNGKVNGITTTKLSTARDSCSSSNSLFAKVESKNEQRKRQSDDATETERRSSKQKQRRPRKSQSVVEVGENQANVDVNSEDDAYGSGRSATIHQFPNVHKTSFQQQRRQSSNNNETKAAPAMVAPAMERSGLLKGLHNRLQNYGGASEAAISLVGKTTMTQTDEYDWPVFSDAPPYLPPALDQCNVAVFNDNNNEYFLQDDENELPDRELIAVLAMDACEDVEPVPVTEPPEYPPPPLPSPYQFQEEDCQTAINPPATVQIEPQHQPQTGFVPVRAAPPAPGKVPTTLLNGLDSSCAIIADSETRAKDTSSFLHRLPEIEVDSAASTVAIALLDELPISAIHRHSNMVAATAGLSRSLNAVPDPDPGSRTDSVTSVSSSESEETETGALGLLAEYRPLGESQLSLNVVVGSSSTMDLK